MPLPSPKDTKSGQEVLKESVPSAPKNPENKRDPDGGRMAAANFVRTFPTIIAIHSIAYLLFQLESRIRCQL